jgi:hypothetical protein
MAPMNTADSAKVITTKRTIAFMASLELEVCRSTIVFSLRLSGHQGVDDRLGVA